MVKEVVQLGLADKISVLSEYIDKFFAPNLGILNAWASTFISTSFDKRKKIPTGVL